MVTSPVFLNDITNDTFTNEGGFQLFTFLEKYIRDNKLVVLSFRDSHALSTSFLNSSFGELISLYGFEAFKANIKPIDLTKSQATIILNYLRSLGEKV